MKNSIYPILFEIFNAPKIHDEKLINILNTYKIQDLNSYFIYDIERRKMTGIKTYDVYQGTIEDFYICGKLIKDINEFERLLKLIVFI